MSEPLFETELIEGGKCILRPYCDGFAELSIFGPETVLDTKQCAELANALLYFAGITRRRPNHE